MMLKIVLFILMLAMVPGSAIAVVLSSPQQYQLFQRDTISGEIQITGTYTGSPAAIEARFLGGDWAVIDSSPTGGTFSETMVAIIGQGDLDVRGVGDDTGIETVTVVGVGDIYWVLGQSNAVGYAVNHMPLGGYPDGIVPVYADENGNWGQYTDSILNPSYGAPWPIVATTLWQGSGIPVAIINTAIGGTSITQHQSTSAFEDPGPYTARYVSTSGITKIRAFLFHQGESDVDSQGEADAYAALLASAIADYKSLFAVEYPFFVAQIHSSFSPYTACYTVQAAQVASWATEGVEAGPPLEGQEPTDYLGEVHFTTDEEIETLAGFWITAIRVGLDMPVDSVSMTGSVVYQ